MDSTLHAAKGANSGSRTIRSLGAERSPGKRTMIASAAATATRLNAPARESAPTTKFVAFATAAAIIPEYDQVIEPTIWADETRDSRVSVKSFWQEKRKTHAQASLRVAVQLAVEPTV